MGWKSIGDTSRLLLNSSKEAKILRQNFSLLGVVIYPRYEVKVDKSIEDQEDIKVYSWGWKIGRLAFHAYFL